MVQKQQTIINKINVCGVGVHSGKEVKMQIKPAAANSGIIFKRTDLLGHPTIKAVQSNVVDTTMCIMIEGRPGVRVSTVEHLMAALWGCGVDNALVEVDGPEVPIMDGSAAAFMQAIKNVGLKSLAADRKYIRPLQRITVQCGESYVVIEPALRFSIECTIDFDHPLIGKQSIVFDNAHDDFEDLLSDARTFGFVKDLERLKQLGLARGASVENAIGLNKDGIINAEGLRYEDEFVRHKALDCIGDLYLAGGFLQAKVSAFRPSHKINNLALKELFASMDACDASCPITSVAHA